jgi:hypothetical protein
VETSYDRTYYGVNLGETAIDITMETRGPEQIAELLAALGAGGYSHERISECGRERPARASTIPAFSVLLVP